MTAFEAIFLSLAAFGSMFATYRIGVREGQRIEKEKDHQPTEDSGAKEGSANKPQTKDQ